MSILISILLFAASAYAVLVFLAWIYLCHLQLKDIITDDIVPKPIGTKWYKAIGICFLLPILGIYFVSLGLKALITGDSI